MIKLSNCCHTTCRTESEGAQPIPFFLFLGLPIPGSLFMRRPTRCRPSRQVSSNRKLAKPAIQLPWLPSRGTRRGTFWWRGVAVGLFVFRCPPPVGAVTQPRAGHTSSSRCDPCDPCKSSAFGEEVPFPMPPLMPTPRCRARNTKTCGEALTSQLQQREFDSAPPRYLVLYSKLGQPEL
jgi:hypothetical protein